MMYLETIYGKLMWKTSNVAHGKLELRIYIYTLNGCSTINGRDIFIYIYTVNWYDMTSIITSLVVLLTPGSNHQKQAVNHCTNCVIGIGFSHLHKCSVVEEYVISLLYPYICPIPLPWIIAIGSFTSGAHTFPSPLPRWFVDVSHIWRVLAKQVWVT